MFVSLFLNSFKNSFLFNVVLFTHKEYMSFSYFAISDDIFSILAVSFSIKRLVNLKVDSSFLILSNNLSAFF